MTGHSEPAAERPVREQPTMARPATQPPAQPAAPADVEAGADPEQERIEIPAFLRRQAN